MSLKKNIKFFTLRIDEELLNKLKVVAEKNKRSVNAQIELLVERCVEEFEKEYGKIEDTRDK